MSFRGLIESAVAMAKTMTADLRVTVYHLPVESVGDYGVELGDEVERSALWEEKIRAYRTGDGTEQISVGKLTFFEPVQVSPHDRFRLPTMAAGTSLPVLRTEGLMDPDAMPYMTEVYLGQSGSQGT